MASRAPSNCWARATCSTCPAASRSSASTARSSATTRCARVAEHWRKQGVPDYIQAVTEEPEDGGYLFDGQPVGEDDAETQLYRKAVQIVAESQKASTSYLQRQLRVGYNSAARLIERMEKDGKVGMPDHVGRREVLIDPDGHADLRPRRLNRGNRGFTAHSMGERHPPWPTIQEI